MIKVFNLATLILLTGFSYGQYAFKNMRLLSHFNDTNLTKVDGDQVWNDVIGWRDTSNNKEYLIAGSTDSIYFFDITDPTKMLLCDVEFGKSKNAINRDYDIYSHYVYCVSDRTSPLGALQIFDLSYLPDSVSKRYENDVLGISTHTIFIDTLNAKLYMCSNTLNGRFSAMDVLSLRNPIQPTLMTRLNGDGFTKVHEVFVKNDTAYCSAEYSGLFIYNMRDTANPKLIGSIRPPYPENGYNHSSWLDSTGKYILFGDELPLGLGLKVFNIEDLSSPDFITVFNSHPDATPHNAYWKGRYVYASSYEDGVQVYDMKEIGKSSPTVAGFFDTYPLNSPGVYNGFHGCWGVWPFLPSGVILASDISEGLFVLETTSSLGEASLNEMSILAKVYPNPFQQSFTIQIETQLNEEVQCEIFSLEGRLLKKQMTILTVGKNDIIFEGLDLLDAGLFELKISGKRSIVHKAILKTN